MNNNDLNGASVMGIGVWCSCSAVELMYPGSEYQMMLLVPWTVEAGARARAFACRQPLSYPQFQAHW